MDSHHCTAGPVTIEWTCQNGTKMQTAITAKGRLTSRRPLLRVDYPHPGAREIDFVQNQHYQLVVSMLIAHLVMLIQ